MVVLVNLVAALLGNNLLCGVVLVVRIYVPTLYAGNDVAALGEVPLTLEAGVLYQVLLHVTVLHRPIGLKGKVGNTEGIDCQAVTVDEYSLVGCNGIAVGMVLAIGVVERTAIGRIAYSLVTYIGVGTIVHADALRLDIALEAYLVAADSEREELLGSVIGLYLELKGIALCARSKVCIGLRIVSTTCIDRI